MFHVTKNFSSVSQFALDDKVYFEFHLLYCYVKDMVTINIFFKGHLRGRLYAFDMSFSKSLVSISSSSLQPVIPPKSTSYSELTTTTSQPSLDLWYRQLAYATLLVVKKALAQSNILYSSNDIALSLCITCETNKNHKLLFTLKVTYVNVSLHVIHPNVQVSLVTSKNCYQYYVYFVDKFSRFIQLSFLTSKSVVTQSFLHFKTKIELQTSFNIKILQSDLRGEFQRLTNSLIAFGIKHQTSCHYTHE